MLPIRLSFERISAIGLIASGFLAGRPAHADALQEYARQCDRAIGVSVPDFDCDAGTDVPGQGSVFGSATTCDEPNRLNKQCDPGSRFQVLTSSDAAYVVAHCRKEDGDSGKYGDIAVIQYSRRNGATCFYQALGNQSHGDLPGGSQDPALPAGELPVKAPSRGQPAWRWLSPSAAAKIGCGGCHDNGPLIRSPYLNQVQGNNMLPGSDDDTFNSDQPYAFVGADFADWKAYTVEVKDNECNTCHRLGVNNVLPGKGTALDLGIRATARSEVAKNPPSAASPIWMPHDPVQVTFSKVHADAAKAIHDCAMRLNEDPLPDSDTCRITQFAAAFVPAASNWERLGGVFASPPAVVASGGGRLDILGLGTDNGMYHKAWTGSDWSPPADWESVGGQFTFSPAAVAPGSNRLDIFGVGSDNAMYHRAWTGSGWSPPADWESLGGEFTSPPAVVSWGTDRVDVFGIGTNQAMYHKALTGSDWAATGEWESLGGVFSSPPAVVSWGSDRLDIFGLGSNKGMYHKAWTGTAWAPAGSGWEPLGGAFSSPPAVVSWGSDRLDIFGLGTDNSLYHKAWTGSAWSPPSGWEPLGGVFSSPPAVVSWGSDRLDIFGLGTDHGMYHKAWNGNAWSQGWEPLGGVFNSPPAVATWGSDRLDVFGLGSDNNMYHRAWTGSDWSPQ